MKQSAEQRGGILVVDDAPENIHILHQALGGEHEVFFALNGDQALAIAKARRPEAILLDIMMPGMDGYAVCAELRNTPATRDIPVIFVTSLARPEDETRALEAGAVDFIHKPISAAVVRARVRTHLTLKRQRDLLRETSAQLQASNEALRQSNRDLEHFAHLAAHDLQAPLTAIAGFTQLLAEAAGEQLGATAQNYLGLIQESTLRMQTQIRDLLAYARLDAQQQPFQPTDLGTLVAETKFILAATLKDKAVDIDSGPLPVLAVDRQQIALLLMNLVQNGIKYNESELPRIRISARRQGGEWIFAVTDNGIGIAPRFQQEVFEIFRRLHSAQAYPGSGIGLAICQRIVNRHGGRIWVVSQEGQGSTFHFTLPAAETESGAAG